MDAQKELQVLRSPTIRRIAAMASKALRPNERGPVRHRHLSTGESRAHLSSVLMNQEAVRRWCVTPDVLHSTGRDIDIRMTLQNGDLHCKSIRRRDVIAFRQVDVAIARSLQRHVPGHGSAHI